MRVVTKIFLTGLLFALVGLVGGKLVEDAGDVFYVFAIVLNATGAIWSTRTEHD